MRENIEFKLITPEECYDLRVDVLTVPNEVYEYQYKEDHDRSTFHVGGFVDGELGCIASFFESKSPYVGDRSSIQLRGMAAKSVFRGMGLGRKLVEFAIKESAGRGYQIIWCNAREHAVVFYEKLGFDVKSEIFMVPRVGLHFVMARDL